MRYPTIDYSIKSENNFNVPLNTRDFFTACPNPHVEGEWEVYNNSEIFCHLSDRDFATFRKYIDVKLILQES